MRRYEMMVILDPDIEERTVAPSLDKYLSVVTTAGGSVDNVDIWGRRRLAYEIDKKTEGIYAVVNFSAESATTDELSTGPVSAAYSPSKTFLNAVTVQYAKELHDTDILVNLGCPGFVATDLNGFRGVRTPEQGAAIAIRLATLPDGGPSGGYFEDAGVIPW